jgi:crotonobetainyl-CoA:carnitine CoA-transferase CaiB-like acyl-CoA transferase
VEAIADTIPGFSALIGILAALQYRNRTGRGQRIDVAQMDAMIGVMQSFSFWEIAGMTFRSAARSGRVGVSGLHKAKDGYVMFSLPAGRITDWFKELMGVEELTPENVSDWVGQRPVDEVVGLLAKTGVPVAPVLDLDQVKANEHAAAREMFVNVDHPTLGEVTLPGFPIKFSETKGDITMPAPLLGQHNEEVYTEILGLSKENIDELRKEGVV